MLQYSRPSFVVPVEPVLPSRPGSRPLPGGIVTDDALLRPTERVRVLCVDDEPSVLAALSRALRPHYDVVTADGAASAIARIESEPGFAVVVSDLRMPGTDGIAFLARVRQLAPDTVRVLLTGHADLSGAIAAVNEGEIFRFLVKPCDTSALLKALRAASEQHRLITAERVLLEQTVHGSIKALTDLLAIVQPASFGRATRVKRHVEALAEALDLPDRWQIEVAALLSQVGFIVIPPETAERVHAGRQLSGAEHDLLDRLPYVAERLIASIPRLDAVRAILRYSQTSFAAGPGAAADGEEVPMGARLLKVAQDLDVLEAQGIPAGLALDMLESRDGVYHPEVLAAMRRLHGSEERSAVLEEMRLVDVRPGMIFAADVALSGGQLLVARGQEVTASLLERIAHHWYHVAAHLHVRMIVTSSGPASARAESARIG